MGSFTKVAWFGLASVGLLLAWLAVALVQPARADEPTPVATLVVHVGNVQAGGLVRLGLYNQLGYHSEDAKPVASADVPAVEGETVITLRDVPPGTYAIETYQDINSNDKMDLTWLGLPLEPYGFSRDARPVLSKPKFSQVKFTLHVGEQSQVLHLRSGVSVLASK
ncbi:MAG: DUF2141 domain-containing protein [Rhizomicrobium sp.]